MMIIIRVAVPGMNGHIKKIGPGNQIQALEKNFDAPLFTKRWQDNLLNLRVAPITPETVPAQDGDTKHRLLHLTLHPVMEDYTCLLPTLINVALFPSGIQ